MSESIRPTRWPSALERERQVRGDRRLADAALARGDRDLEPDVLQDAPAAEAAAGDPARGVAAEGDFTSSRIVTAWTPGQAAQLLGRVAPDLLGGRGRLGHDLEAEGDVAAADRQVLDEAEGDDVAREAREIGRSSGLEDSALRSARLWRSCLAPAPDSMSPRPAPPRAAPPRARGAARSAPPRSRRRPARDRNRLAHRQIATSRGSDREARRAAGRRTCRTMPIGRIGSPERIARSAAPALKGRSSPVRVRVSSGKTTRERPPWQPLQRRVDDGRAARARPAVDRHEARPPPWTSPGIGRRKRLRLARKRDRHGQRGEENEDVVEALVVGGDDEARRPLPNRSGVEHPHAHAGSRPGSCATRLARNASTSRPAGRHERHRNRRQAEDDRRGRDHDPDAERPKESHGAAIVAERDKSRRVRRLQRTERRRRMPRPHDAATTVRDGDLLSQPPLAAIRRSLRPQGLSDSSTTSAASAQLLGQTFTALRHPPVLFHGAARPDGRARRQVASRSRASPRSSPAGCSRCRPPTRSRPSAARCSSAASCRSRSSASSGPC